MPSILNSEFELVDVLPGNLLDKKIANQREHVIRYVALVHPHARGLLMRAGVLLEIFFAKVRHAEAVALTGSQPGKINAAADFAPRASGLPCARIWASTATRDRRW